MLYVLLVIFSIYFAIMWIGSFIQWTKAKNKKDSHKYLAEIFINIFLIMAFILLVEVLSK